MISAALLALARRLYARACARGHAPYCMLWRRSVPARGRAPRSTVGMYRVRKTIACCPCTPPLTMETFGEKICAEACSGKEIAGLLEEEKMM